MFEFGAGTLWGFPVGGNTAANPTPMKFGTLQDVSLDISGDVKQLYGQKQFPEAVARGKCKITGKSKFAAINGKMLNDLFFGQTMGAGMIKTSLEITIEASLTDTINGVPILQAIGQGLFDGASFKIDRLFMDPSSNQIGTVVRFSGFIGALDELTRSSAKLSVNAGTAYLSMQLPAVILQPGCTNTLFDARCGLVKASFAEANVVQAGSTINKVLSLSAKGDGYYDNGQIAFISGANAGLVKAVKQYFSTGGPFFTFNSPLPFAPNAGDQFTAYPGCDKTQATCASSKFSNLVNFEGFPYVPAPETAI